MDGVKVVVAQADPLVGEAALVDGRGDDLGVGLAGTVHHAVFDHGIGEGRGDKDRYAVGAALGQVRPVFDRGALEGNGELVMGGLAVDVHGLAHGRARGVVGVDGLGVAGLARPDRGGIGGDFGRRGRHGAGHPNGGEAQPLARLEVVGAGAKVGDAWRALAQGALGLFQHLFGPGQPLHRPRGIVGLEHGHDGLAEARQLAKGALHLALDGHGRAGGEELTRVDHRVQAVGPGGPRGDKALAALAPEAIVQDHGQVGVGQAAAQLAGVVPRVVGAAGPKARPGLHVQRQRTHAHPIHARGQHLGELRHLAVDDGDTIHPAHRHGPGVQLQVDLVAGADPIAQPVQAGDGAEVARVVAAAGTLPHHAVQGLHRNAA